MAVTPGSLAIHQFSDRFVMKTAQAFTKVMERPVRKNRVLAAMLAALLVGSTWCCVWAWRAAPSMPLYGNIIMGVAAILVLAAGCGLITLVCIKVAIWRKQQM